MRTINVQDFINWNSCYPPTNYLAENWVGTAVDILNMTNIPALDRIWAVMHPSLLPDNQMRMFAVWCARQVDQLDSRSSNAINISENFANGNCAEYDRSVAEHSAWVAVSDSQQLSPDLYAAAKAAAHCSLCSSKSAAQGASFWSSNNSDSAQQTALQNAQIQQAISIFNQYGL